MSLTFLRKTTGNIDFTILRAVVRAKSDDVFISISPSQPSSIAFNGIFSPQVQNSVQYSSIIRFPMFARLRASLEGIRVTENNL